MARQDIVFVADDHYGAHPGAVLAGCLRDRYHCRFFENDWTGLEHRLLAQCRLLILNLIAGTCNQPLPGPDAEQAVQAYVRSRKPVLLLHGGSAAFWHWDWWRPLVGCRWVRGDDPDGFQPSVHPKAPYRVEVAKCRHPLCRRLRGMNVPEDEIYTQLEQTLPVWQLMTTTIDDGTFVQAYEATTPYGGKVLGFLPGHRAEVVKMPVLVNNVATMIEYALTNS